MSASANQTNTAGGAGKIVWIVVFLVGAILVGGLIYYSRSGSTGSAAQVTTLEGAVRPGTAEWSQNADKIVLDKPEADEAKRALGDIVMNLHTTVRNFTGRTITGLEIHGVVVDLQGKPVKERSVVIIPNRVSELEPNKTVRADLMLDGMKESDTRADIRMSVTGFRLK
jgi:hypothetical protein